MRVPRLRRRDAEVTQEEHPFRARGRTLSFAPDFAPGRFECFPADGETMLLRIAGEWRGTPPEFSMLAVKAGGRTKRFQSLPSGPPAVGEPWRAAFAVPSALVEPASRYALSAHGSWVPLPEPEMLAQNEAAAAPATETPAAVEQQAAEAREERDQALAAMADSGAAEARWTLERGELEEQLSQRDGLVHGLERQLTERDEAIERIGRELVEARAQTESKATELAEARAEIESKESELQGEIESLRELITTAQAERDAAAARAEKHEGEVNALHRRANEIARELTERTEVVTRLEGELAEARSSLEQRQQEIEAGRAELDAARARIQELEQRVAQTREALRVGVGNRLWGSQSEAADGLG